MLNKDKIFLYLDWAIIASLCILFFCLPFAKAGAESFTLLAFFLWIIKKILGYRVEALWGMLPRTELNKVLAIFIAANALSVIFSSHLGLSLRAFFGKELKFLAIYFMLVEVINSKKRLKVVLITVIVSALLLVLDAGVQYSRGLDFLRGFPLNRLTASFQTANGFAGWLIVVILLFLGLLISDKIIGKGLKVLLLMLIPLLGGCLLGTYARGAWLGFAIGVFFIVVYAFKGFSFKIKLLCVSISVFFLATCLIFPQALLSRVKALGRINFKSSETVNARVKSTLKIDAGSTPIRLKLWKEALRITRDYPLFGCGLNTYSKIGPKYKSFDWGGVYPHNSYLQMSAEIGLIGLFAFLWVLFSFFKVGLRHFNQKKDYLALGLLAGILAFLVHAFFDTHLYSLQLVVLFWYMLGLTVAVIKLNLE
ncbi:MAG: O-antigen ligase family protein [Candidatus Omnitrophota bacterium]